MSTDTPVCPYINLNYPVMSGYLVFTLLTPLTLRAISAARLRSGCVPFLAVRVATPSFTSTLMSLAVTFLSDESFALTWLSRVESLVLLLVPYPDELSGLAFELSEFDGWFSPVLAVLSTSSLSSTRLTPSVPRAICTTRMRSASVLTVPDTVTTPLSVSTLISLPFRVVSFANSDLMLFVVVLSAEFPLQPTKNNPSVRVNTTPINNRIFPPFVLTTTMGSLPDCIAVCF